MFNATLVGRLFNGKVYKGKDDSDRKIFRGRMNYRDARGEYQWIDAVCFRDMGDKGGLVGLLDEHFSAPGDGDNGGRGVILVGSVRPTKKKKTIEIVGKKGGTTVKKELEVDYDTYEFVIENLTFPPKSKGESTSKKSADLDEDFDFDDDIEVADKSSKDDSEEAEESSSKSSKKDKKKKKDDDDDDDDFFE